MSGEAAVAKYAVEHVVDGDGNETIHIAVALPGIKSGADIKCVIQDRLCRVVVPGLYLVEIPLSCTVESKAESVRYVKKKEVLKCVLRVRQGDRASSSDEEGPSMYQGSRQANGSSQQAQQPKPAASLRDVYEEAKQQAARESAEDCERLARAAEQQGDLLRAVRLLQKACQLVPGAKYQLLLAEAERNLARSGSGADGSSNSSQAGTSSSSSSTAGPSGTARSAAPPPQQPEPPRHSPPPPPTPQQQQQQRQQAGEEDEERWQGQSSGARRALVPGSAVSLVLGLSLMAAAGYCMYGVTWHQLPAQLEEEGLVQAGSTAATAAAAAASVIRSSDAGAAAARAGADAAAAAAGAASVWQRWPGWHPPMRCPKSMFVEGDGPCDVTASFQPDGANLRQPDSTGQAQPATCSGEDHECRDSLGPEQPGEAAADEGSAACSGGDCGSVNEPGWLWHSLQGLQGRLAWTSPAWHAVSWLPRTLLWDPSWEVVVCWAMFVGGVYLFLPSAQRMLLGSDWLLSKPVDWRDWCILAGWQPLGWLACGGGWLALIEVPLSWSASGPLRMWLSGRAAPSQLGGVTLVYFIASLAIRWLGPYVFYVLLAPLRLIVWAPRWWTHAPMVAAAIVYRVGKPEDHDPSSLAIAGSAVLVLCWLSGGGWSAVACLSLFLLVPFSVYLDSNGKCSPAFNTGLRKAGLGLPCSAVVGRLVWMFSHSLWASVPVALALLGLLAVWQADAGGSAKGGRGGGKAGSGGGGRAGSGGGPFNFFGTRGAQQQRKGGEGSIPAHLEHEVPAGAPEAVARVLSSGNYYEVLGVGRDADEATIKRAKRTLSLATHPDKIGNLPGVNEAFNLVTEAADVLGDAAKRGEYEAELTQLEFEARLGSDAPGGGIFGGMGAAAAGMAGSNSGGEPGFGLPHACSCCGGVHIMRLVPRMAEMARYCADCKTLHPVREGEVWIERTRSGWFGYELRMYTCHGGLVWDISELGNCEGLFRAARQYDFPFNAHVNPLGGFGRGQASSSRAGGRGERRRQQQEEKGRNKGGRKGRGRRR